MHPLIKINLEKIIKGLSNQRFYQKKKGKLDWIWLGDENETLKREPQDKILPELYNQTSDGIPDQSNPFITSLSLVLILSTLSQSFSESARNP